MPGGMPLVYPGNFGLAVQHDMQRYQWSHLNTQQIGAYAEYFVKMELTMYGFQVYETEVDDRGIDFIARYESGPFIEVQVKSLRSLGYIFAHKEKFALRENLLMAVALFSEGKQPNLFLVPATAWLAPSELLVSRDYEGRKSKPEWGVNVSRKNMPALDQYGFENVVSQLRR
ncbi:MAG: hypothetical protein PHU46_04985 [Rhodocyclaceae bacterium]|nr:hypothetical protein [Rhodocyclaceae bacterium]